MKGAGRRPGAARSLLRALRRARRSGSPSLSELGRAVPRMARATLSGSYTGLSRVKLATMAGAAAYIVSPVDLLPEELLGPLGLVDDAAVLSWLAAALLAETEAFLAWERTPGAAGGPAGTSGGGPGGAPGAPGGPPRPPSSHGPDDVVEGEVVP